MNGQEVATLHRELQDARSLYERALQRLAKDRNDFVTSTTGEPSSFDGREVALEAHVRLYFLDRFLRALGWDPESADKMVAEDPVDPSDPNSKRRFLDYHGRDCTDATSFLIVEAKRPNFSIPKGDVEWQIAAHIWRTNNDAEPNPFNQARALTVAWGDIVSTMTDYASRARDKSGEPPAVAMISNGDWFIIFRDVAKTLLSKNPDPSKVVVIGSYDELCRRLRDVYTWLGYRALSGRIPAQRPAAIEAFVAPGRTAYCCHVAILSYVRHGDDQPLISARVAVWIRSDQGAWVLFRKEYPGDEFLVMLPNDERRAMEVAQALRDRIKNLIDDLKGYRPIEIVSAEDFEVDRGPIVSAEVPPGSAGSSLVVRIDGPTSDRFALALGKEASYLTSNGTFDDCPLHYWAKCRESGDAVGAYAIVGASTTPPSYFQNGSIFHCAHSAVHERRKHKCVLSDFEEFLCCRRCAYFSRCWGADGSSLPCRHA